VLPKRPLARRAADGPSGLAEPPPTSAQDELVRRHVRGSSLLLAGRALQLASNLAVQLMIVRYLSKTGYGEFAYALAIVTLGETVSLFGLDRAIGRLIPIHLEKREYRTAFGVLVLALGIVITVGCGLIALISFARGSLDHLLVSDQRAVTLLVLMIALAPIQALEDLLQGLFGVLARPRTIFVRAYVLEPAFRFTVALALILTHSNVYFLALGYVLAGVVGLAISTLLLIRILRSEDLLRHFRFRTMQIPFRGTLAFTLPLLSTDLVNVLLFSVDAVLLGHFRGPQEVASFRVIFPLASLNMVAFSVFTVLYIPLASRLFARGDGAGIDDLYRKTSVWIAVFTFPIFAFTFFGAAPLTTLLYGSRYESSALFLSILAVGYYVRAALGFNGMTLMVYGRVRDLTALNVLAMVFNLGINLVLIPRYGALGAAIGTSITLVLHNILMQIALRVATGMRLFTSVSARPLAIIGAIVVGLALLRPIVGGHPYASLALAALAAALAVGANRRSLDIGQMFPELLRLPGLQRLSRIVGRPKLADGTDA
jgi:O-antigen/teichoic acid export membrane protein